MKLVVDTDPGVDDTLALLYLSSLDKIEIEAITVVEGNSTQKNCLKNANYITELADIDAPVYKGSDKPLNRDLETADSHGKNGLGNLEVSEDYERSDGAAVEAIIENADSNTKLLTLGPLTNLAKAIRKEPDVLSKYESVTVMGGAVDTFGNVNRVSEFNFWVDPYAADIVLQAPSDNLTLVPVNACRKVVVSASRLEEILPTELMDIFQPYLNYYQKESTFDGAIMYDLLAAAIAVKPELADYACVDMVIETKGDKTRGMLVPEKRPQKKRKNKIKYAKNPVEDIENKIISNLNF